MSEHHKFHMRLPRSGKEMSFFLLIVSLISVNIIAPIAAMMEAGFSLEVWHNVLRTIPIIWVCVVVFVLLTQKPARWLTGKIIAPTDSFNAHIVVELLMNVLLMSVLLTVVGGWIGSGWQLPTLDQHVHSWPRNFAIAFAVEVLVAHPVAHFVMHHFHLRRDGTISSRFVRAQSTQ